MKFKVGDTIILDSPGYSRSKFEIIDIKDGKYYIICIEPKNDGWILGKLYCYIIQSTEHFFSLVDNRKLKLFRKLKKVYKE